MRRLWLLIAAILLATAVIAPFTYFSTINLSEAKPDPFYFGVTYGLQSVEGAKLLIDRVQNYTNLFIMDSSSISNNETALNEVCNYAASKNLHFIVYFFSLYAHDWQQSWVATANQTWPGQFLGVYLRDEPGGRQIERNESVQAASNYTEAAKAFAQNVSATWSMQYLKQHQIPVFTSDFALYWFDYQGGFDCMFAQVGWNGSIEQQIGLCRGAANIQGKEWGAIITWTYQQEPYYGSGTELYEDLVMSYQAGAKYLTFFNFPQHPEDNPYGVLTEEHFLVLEQFWNYSQQHPQNSVEVAAEVALVLPAGYGSAMRNPDDTIWGLWPADNNSAQIWQNTFTLIEKYGFKLDIIYEDADLAGKYQQLYLWNQTVT